MNTRDLGLFVVRGVVGGTAAAHGFQKLFGWFGGGGPETTAEMFSAMGFEHPREFALASGVAEGVGGSLLVLGAATPVGAAAVAGNMAVAASVHRPNGFFNADGGLELPAVLSAAAAALALTGPGNLSVDRLFKHRWSKGWMGLATLAAAGGVASRLIMMREEKASSSGTATGDSRPSSSPEDLGSDPASETSAA